MEGGGEIGRNDNTPFSPPPAPAPPTPTGRNDTNPQQGLVFAAGRFFALGLCCAFKALGSIPGFYPLETVPNS